MAKDTILVGTDWKDRRYQQWVNKRVSDPEYLSRAIGWWKKFGEFGGDAECLETNRISMYYGTFLMSVVYASERSLKHLIRNRVDLEIAFQVFEMNDHGSIIINAPMNYIFPEVVVVKTLPKGGKKKSKKKK